MTRSDLPRLGTASDFFWTSGSRGELQVRWCPTCTTHLHPSVDVCPGCRRADLEAVTVSGKGIVVAFTVNQHQWHPEHPPPYVVAVVALAEDPTIRLTTNIVGCPPDEVRVGIPVRARFEGRADVWIPVFEPVPEPVSQVDEAPPSVKTRPPVTTGRFEHTVALTGIGSSAVGRRLAQGPLSLTVEACQRAMADAGLAGEDIDGLCSYPGSTGLHGVSAGGIRQLEQVLELHPTWHNGAHETPGQTGAVITAMLAVASGLCRHVLCFSTVAEDRRPSVAPDQPGRADGELAWRLPFGAASPVNWIALYASHYMARYKADRECLGWIALTARRHAQLNPAAVYRDPLTMEDYLAARMISSPLGLYDCDVPCDASIAVIVSDQAVARDLRQPPVLVDAVGTQITERQSWDQGTITHQANVFGPAAHLWSRASLGPADVDVAQLYDGFTFNALCWLEGLGFCEPGEGPSFVEGGKRIGLGGELPLNTHGGQLSAGRTNGYGALHEAVLQLRGHAGARQVAGAEVAVTSSGGGIPASCMLLTTDR